MRRSIWTLKFSQRILGRALHRFPRAPRPRCTGMRR